MSHEEIGVQRNIFAAYSRTHADDVHDGMRGGQVKNDLFIVHKLIIFACELFNSLTCKLLQCFYLPTSKQYGEYVIEFKSFHQNGNISETVA